MPNGPYGQHLAPGRLRPWACVAVALALAGCAATVQTGSGRDYLARTDYVPPAPGKGATPSVDRAVYEAASTEPLLRFPARLGLARIAGGALTAVPPAEADHWLALMREFGPSYGEFVPISPLVVELAAGPTRYDDARSVVDRIRIGAGRQQVDAVLVYEVTGTSKDQLTPLSVLDLTVVGAFLVPSRSVGGQARANAMLVDVRNGYPYGTASATAEAGGLSTNAGSTDRSQALTETAQAEAVRKLTGEIRGMLVRLKSELDTRELTRLRARQDAQAPAAEPVAVRRARNRARSAS